MPTERVPRVMRSVLVRGGDEISAGEYRKWGRKREGFLLPGLLPALFPFLFLFSLIRLLTLGHKLNELEYGLGFSGYNKILHELPPFSYLEH